MAFSLEYPFSISDKVGRATDTVYCRFKYDKDDSILYEFKARVIQEWLEGKSVTWIADVYHVAAVKIVAWLKHQGVYDMPRNPMPSWMK